MITIESLRKRIDLIDNQLFKLLGERLEVAKSIAVIKQKEGLSIVDMKREGELLQKIREKAEKIGVNPQSTADIWKEIMDLSKEVQQ